MVKQRNHKLEKKRRHGAHLSTDRQAQGASSGADSISICTDIHPVDDQNNDDDNDAGLELTVTVVEDWMGLKTLAVQCQRHNWNCILSSIPWDSIQLNPIKSN
jgi:hypothetical protein